MHAYIHTYMHTYRVAHLKTPKSVVEMSLTANQPKAEMLAKKRKFKAVNEKVHMHVCMYMCVYVYRYTCTRDAR